MVWKPLPKGFKKEKYVVPSFKIAHFFKDGEEIDLGGRMLEANPHTEAHTRLRLLPRPRSPSTLTGDMFYTGGIYTYLNCGDIPTFIKSYRKMLTYYNEFNRFDAKSQTSYSWRRSYLKRL